MIQQHHDRQPPRHQLEQPISGQTDHPAAVDGDDHAVRAPLPQMAQRPQLRIEIVDVDHADLIVARAGNLAHALRDLAEERAAQPPEQDVDDAGLAPPQAPRRVVRHVAKLDRPRR